MPNINISESDKSNFSDQQFIQIAYNGKTNIKSTPLTYRVTFTVDGNPYYIVDIGENQKISAPSVAPTKEGYTFKNWLLNDEAFDFDNIIEESIILVAEFEETPAPSEYIYSGNLEYYSADDYVLQSYRTTPLTDEEKAKLATIDTNKTYKVTIADGDTLICEFNGSVIDASSEAGLGAYAIISEPYEGYFLYSPLGFQPEGSFTVYINCNAKTIERAVYGTYLTTVTEVEPTA